MIPKSTVLKHGPGTIDDPRDFDQCVHLATVQTFLILHAQIHRLLAQALQLLGKQLVLNN